MPDIEPPDPKAQPLLRLIVEAIACGRIRADDPGTFLTYSEALELLGRPNPSYFAGSRLQKAGLNALNEWTKQHCELPTIAALIVNKKSRIPGKGFPESHDYHPDDSRWMAWWMEQANLAINYDWKPFLVPIMRYQRISEKTGGPSLREPDAPAYRAIITVEPGKRGGRPCIRGMRITVGDILGWLAAGMSEKEIVADFPELSAVDIHAALAFAADRERHTVSLAALRE